MAYVKINVHTETASDRKADARWMEDHAKVSDAVKVHADEHAQYAASAH